MLRKLLWVFLGLVVLQLLITAGYSLSWRMFVDSPILTYVAVQMKENGLLPYRDIFEMNMPGVHLFDWARVSIFGRSDPGFRIADLCWLSSLIGLTWILLRRFGALTASFGAVVPAVCYLAYGPYFSMQREYVILVPLAASMVVLTDPRLSRLRVSPLLAGFLIGSAGTIKPHAVLAFLPAALFLWKSPPPEEDEGDHGASSPARRVLLFTAGGTLPFILLTIYLLATGSMSAFLEIALEYWPLYTSLSFGHQVMAGPDRISYLIRGFASFGPTPIWFAPAMLGLVVGIYHAGLPEEDRRIVWLLAGMTGAFLVYPTLAGKFWDYHFLPVTYFLILLGALSLSGKSAPDGLRRMAGGTLLLVILTQAHIPLEVLDSLTGNTRSDPRIVKSDEMAEFLRANLRPGDKVQPLDWTGGAVQAMLNAGAVPATRFIYDFHFYHHVSSPYTRKLRNRFIDELNSSRPRFILEVTEGKPWVWGDDTSREFRGLERIVLADYKPVHTGEGFLIFERK